MPEWLETSFATDAEPTATLIASRLGLSLGLGFVVAWIYRVTQGRSGEQARGLMATLVLLSVLICMMTLVIGNNVARAFSLVGALAIVRFRTVVEDTRDTAFVIFAVSVGMAVGAGFLKVPFVAIPVAGLAALAFRPRPGATDGVHQVVVRITPGVTPEALIAEVVGRHTTEARVRSVLTARQGAAVETTYGVRFRDGSDARKVLDELGRVEGVQGVEVTRP